MPYYRLEVRVAVSLPEVVLSERSASSSEGLLLPSTEPQDRLARRGARAATLEAEARENPAWAEKYRPAKPRKKRQPKPPKESRIYKTAMAYIALRAQGVSVKDIAEQLGLAVNTVKSHTFLAHRKGWINMASLAASPEDQLDIVLASKAVRNIEQLLDGGEAACQGDKDTTLEIAKGIGLLKQHQVVKNTGESTVGVALRVQVEMPPPGREPVTIRPGSVGGAPAFEAEVVGEGE